MIQVLTLLCVGREDLLLSDDPSDERNAGSLDRRNDSMDDGSDEKDRGI